LAFLTDTLRTPIYASVAGTTQTGLYALGASSDTIYVGGGFSIAGRGDALNIAALVMNQKEWITFNLGTNASILALAMIGRDLYAIGHGSSAGWTIAHEVMRWENGETSRPLGSGITQGWNVPRLPAVMTIAAGGGRVYVGGQFERAGNLERIDQAGD